MGSEYRVQGLPRLYWAVSQRKENPSLRGNEWTQEREGSVVLLFKGFFLPNKPVSFFFLKKKKITFFIFALIFFELLICVNERNRKNKK